MEHFNQRGQVLIESVFVVLSIASLLILFQLMIDQQKKDLTASKLSKMKKEIIYDSKNKFEQTK
jgi:hypothetical protein